MMKNTIQKLKENNVIKNIFKNSSYLVIQNIITMIIGAFVTAIISRYFGPEKYGVFNYVLSITTIFLSISTMGLNNIVVRDLSQKKEKVNEIIGTSLVLKSIFCVLLILICDTIIYFLNREDLTIQIIGIILSGCMLFAPFEIFNYYIQVKLKVKYSAIAKITSTVIFSMLKVLIVVLKLNLVYLAVAYLVEASVFGILIYVLYRRLTQKETENIKWKFDKEYAITLLKSCWYFAISSIMVTLYMKIDQVMLGSMIEDKAELGIYSAAVRISEMWSFVPLAVITSFKPIITDYQNRSEKQYNNNIQRLYNITWLLCLCFVIGIVLLGKIIILILYGEQYLAAYNVIYILAIAISFGILGNINNIWLACEKKEKYSLISSTIGCFCNIILNIYMIPKYKMLGAAITTLISQFISNVAMLNIYHDTRILGKKIIKGITLTDILGHILKKEKEVS